MLKGEENMKRPASVRDLRDGRMLRLKKGRVLLLPLWNRLEGAISVKNLLLLLPLRNRLEAAVSVKNSKGLNVVLKFLGLWDTFLSC